MLKVQNHNRQSAGKGACKLGEGSGMTTTVPVNGIISRLKEVTSKIDPCFLIIHCNDWDLGMNGIISEIVD